MESNKSKKPLTMVSGIMSIVLAVALLIFGGYLSVIIFILIGIGSSVENAVSWVLGGWLLFLLVLLILLAIVITMIVLGAKRIKLSTVSDIEYDKRKSSIIGNLVFDGIIFVAMLAFGIALAIGNSDTYTYILALIYAVLMLMCFIFLLTDLLIFNKKVKTGKILLANSQPVPSPKKTFDVDELKQNLTKLKELRDNGALTEEEYETAKAKELSKHD